jgi:predicted nucleic acid-binding Zn ribbon protein
MKKCPFCAEEIQDEAVKCKHCCEFLIDAELRGLKKDTGSKWYYTTPMIILWILLLQPLALPFIWKNPQYDTTKKIIWTVITIVFTILLTLLLTSILTRYLQWMGNIATNGL